MAEPDPRPPSNPTSSAMDTTGGAPASPNNTPSAQAPAQATAPPPPQPPPPVVPQATVNLSHQALHEKGRMCSDCTDRRWFDCDFSSRPVGPNGIRPPCSNCRFHGGRNAKCFKGGSLHDSLFIQARRGTNDGLPAPKVRTNDPMQHAPANWQGNPNPVGQLQLPPNLQGPNLIARLGLTVPARPTLTPRSRYPNRGQVNPTGAPAQAYPHAAGLHPQPNGSYQYPPINAYGQPAIPQLGFSIQLSFPAHPPAIQGYGVQDQNVSMEAPFSQQHQYTQQQGVPRYSPPYGYQSNMQQSAPLYGQPQGMQQYGQQYPQQSWPEQQAPRPANCMPPPESFSQFRQQARGSDTGMLPPTRLDRSACNNEGLDAPNDGFFLPDQGSDDDFKIRGHASREYVEMGDGNATSSKKRKAEEDTATPDSVFKRQKSDPIPSPPDSKKRKAEDNPAPHDSVDKRQKLSPISSQAEGKKRKAENDVATQGSSKRQRSDPRTSQAGDNDNSPIESRSDSGSNGSPQSQ